MISPDLHKQIWNENSARKLLWLVILATLWVVTLLIIPRIPTPKPAIDSKLLALRVMLCCIFLAGIFNFRQLARQAWTFTDTIFGTLLLSFCLSTAFSGRFLYSVSTTWQSGALVIVGWIIYRLMPSKDECRGLLWIAAGLGVLASLYGFLTYIGADILRSFYPFEFEENQGGRNFIHSFFGNPEYYGGFAAPTAVLLWGLAMQPRVRLSNRVAWTACTVFVLMVLALSGSRGAFIGFFAGAAVVFLGQITLLHSAVRKAALTIIGCGLVLLMIGVAILSTPNSLNPRDMRLLQRFASLTDTQAASVRERLMFYTSTAAAIPDNPVFGYGPGTYKLEFLNNVKRLVDEDPRAGTIVITKELDRRLAEHAHNDYLEIWFEQGTLGFGAFLLLLIHGAVRFVQTRWSGTQTLSADHLAITGLHVTVFAGGLAMAVNAMTSFPFQMPARATLGWILIAAFFALDKQLREIQNSSVGIDSKQDYQERQ